MWRGLYKDGRRERDCSRLAAMNTTTIIIIILVILLLGGGGYGFSRRGR
jgi:hypothetical protein